MDSEPLTNFLFINSLNYSDIGLIISLILLLLGSAFISGSEVAYFSLTHNDIDAAKEKKVKYGNLIIEHLKSPQKLLATILIANNFINVSIVIISSFLINKYIAAKIIHFSGYTFDFKFILEVIIITFVILLFGEIIPKIYANHNSLVFANTSAKPLIGLEKILRPLVYLLVNSTTLIENKLRKKSDLSINKLSQALELTGENGNKDQYKLLEGIVNFGAMDAKQIMTPRIDLFSLEISQSYSEVLEQVSDKNYSRIPVYEDSIDNIKGVLFTKDLIPYLNEEDFDWKKLVRKVIYVTEYKKLDDLLAEFQQKKQHIAVVVDEFGGTSGIVSLDDVITEIVGEINDEFYDEGLEYSKLDDKNYVFEGKTSLKDFYKVLDIEEDAFENAKGEADSLAGFVLEQIGTFPRKGVSFKFRNLTFTIDSLNKKRVKQIKITLD